MSLKDLDLGSTILSLAIAAGFIAFLALVLRVILLGVNFLMENINNRKILSKEIKDNNKGFKKSKASK